MGFRLLADLIVVLHAAFVLFVVAGAVLVAKWPRLLPVHLVCLVWGTGTEFTGMVCPLTPLENHLRRLAGQSGYAGGFIEHYVIPVIYPPGLTPGIQLALGMLAVGVNVAAYTALWRRRHAG